MGQRIIVRSVNWLGDAVMALPTIDAIRYGFPDAEISILTRPSLASLFEGNPAVAQVIPLPGSSLTQLSPFSPFLKGLKKKSFNLAVILPNSFQSALVFFMAGMQERIGYSTEYRKLLLTRAVVLNPTTQAKHQVHCYFDLLKSLNLELTSVRPEIHLPELERRRGAELIETLGLGTQIPGPLIGFNAGAVYGPAKRWPAEKYAALARQLKDAFNANILLFGSREDGNVSDKIQTSTPGIVINLTGKFSLSDYMRLLTQCDLIVTNDSGGMHLAAALGVPLVAIFGSTNPFRTGPLSGKQRIIYKKAECSPCLKRVCPTDFTCLNKVDVEEVFQAVTELLGCKED